MSNILKRKRIELSYDNILIAFFGVVFFLDAKCLCLVDYKRSYDLNACEILAIAVIGFFFIMLFSRVGRYYLGTMRFIVSVLIYMVIIIFITAIYSMMVYGENVLDVYIGACHFFLLFSTLLYAYLFQRDQKTMHLMIRIFCFIGIASIIVTIIQGICSQLGIPSFFLGSYRFGRYRYGRIRLSPTNIGRFSTIYMFYRFITDREGRLFTGVCSIAGLFAIIYYGSTRIDIISLTLCVVVMLFLVGKKKKIYRVLLVLGTIVFLFSGFASTILASFSSEGGEAGSTIARMGAIQYYYSYFKSNPLLGMGLVMPRNAYLTSIWSGPSGIYHFDDLGLMGGLFRYGVLGIVFHIIPIIRMTYIAIKMVIQKRSEGIWAVGAITYILVSQISLNYLDYQRTLIFPLYWALFETLYKNENYCFGLISEEREERDGYQKFRK